MADPQKGANPPPAAPPPASIEKLLDIARRQSKQLEEVTSQSLPAKSAVVPLPERKNTIGRKSLLGPVEAYRPPEIEPADEPAESSNRRQSVPAGVREKTVQVDSLEQLKELHARAIASGPSACLRKDLTFESYGRANFKTARGWFTNRDGDEMLKFTYKRINEPLLQYVRQRDSHDAVAVFAHLMAYMGDLDGTKAEVDHLRQVLSGGLRKPGLRDEFFCQICRQTTENPESASNLRGWHAMAISCGLFLPSEGFLPVLQSHLEQVVHGFVRSSTDKGKSSLEIDPPHLASYSLFRLRKLLRFGPRHLLPLPEEIEAVEKVGNISATIYLPDSTSKSMPLDPMITTEEVVVKIVQILGLSEPKYFCLYEVDPNQVEKSLGGKEYVAEVQSRWASTCIPKSVTDFQSPWRKLMSCWRQTHKKIATVKDVYDELVDQLFVNSASGDHEPRLLFKRNLFLSAQNVAANIKNRELALDYSQAVHDVLRGAFPLTEHDLVMLAALQLRAELGSNLPRNAKGMKIINYLPQHLEGDEEKLKGVILSMANGLPGDPSPATRRVDYLDYLKTRYVLAQASWFSAKQTDNEAIPGAFWVAINSSGVFFLQLESKDEILHMKYTEICSWAYSQTSFSIVTGNAVNNEDHRLITLQGSDMSKAMQLFVNRMF
ncbi:unnamed protein product [Calypogeia fissa]